MGGDKPIGLVIAGIAVAALVLLPALLVPVFYVFANILAIVTGSDLSSDTLGVAMLLTGLAVLVATILVAMAVVMNLIGRSLSPKRRREA
jgi:hypothetical protein